MNTSFDEKDEISRLWQKAGREQNNKEVREAMELVERRSKQFEQTIFWRNAREYGAAVFVALVFALFALTGTEPMVRTGHAIVSVSGLWIIGFLWLMQRSSQAPLPESSSEDYQRALLAKYDRQILLTKTAWAWYVLPLTTGLVVAFAGQSHGPSAGLALAGLAIVFGVGIAALNWKAAAALTAEKRELQRFLDTAD